MEITVTVDDNVGRSMRREINEKAPDDIILVIDLIPYEVEAITINNTTFYASKRGSLCRATSDILRG